MTARKDRSGKADDLRRRAEEQARGKAARIPENLERMSPGEARKVLHELRVHQIELEMQNEELRRAQQELEASRARYFDLYDLAPVGYCTLNEQGLILEANLTAGTMLGTARNAMIKQPLTRFILPGDQDTYYRHRQQLIETGKQQACELRMLRAGEAPFWTRIEAAMAQDHDGAPVCRTVMSDITAQRNLKAAFHRRAKELREKNDGRASLRKVNSHAPGSRWVRRRGKPVSILLLEDDPAYAEAIQRALLDSSVNAVIHTVRNFRDYQALAAAQPPDIAIVDILPPEGDAVNVLTSPAEAGPFPILIMTGCGDARIAVEAMKAGAIDYIEKSSGFPEDMPHIVERALREWDLLLAAKRAEETLRREKENYKHSLDNSPLGVSIVTADEDALYANRAVLDMYGYDGVEELRSTPVKKRYTPESYVGFLKRMKKRRSGSFGPSEYEISIVRKTGEIRHLHVFRKETLWNGEKQFQTLYRDITEEREREEILREFARTIQGQKMLLDQQSSSVSELIERLTRSKAELKASYEALKANKDELIRSEKLVFTGRMAASIAHEIRNPLTNIMLSIRQLIKEDRIKPSGLQYAGILERNTSRIQFLITELLNCARPIKLDLRPWDVHQVINSVLNTHKVRFKTQGIKVTRKLAACPSTVRIDREYLGRVLLNLVANAIESMPSGGRLSIATALAKGTFMIKVRDSGRGIPEKNLLKIFDPFFSTKKTGTGLGLTTCQNIVSSHGGTIEVESKWRKGSIFSICLPDGRKP